MLDINKLDIISGKPVYKSGKSWDDFFGTEKTIFINALFQNTAKTV
ncbi:MAG: hypothetical protein ACJA2N_002129 [Salibacteraceae bacterium]|jgi:hypothetical protein